MLLIQKIFSEYGKAYIEKFGSDMLPLHKKALIAIMNCRMPSLGGQTYYCSHCTEYHYSYHSCQNRHCPICQNKDAQEWLTKQKQLLLPLTYFLATFTIPENFRQMIRKNQKLFYNILFKAGADSLKLLAKDEKYMGAEIGMIGILHTWTRAMFYHPHVHFLIAGGGLGKDGRRIHFSDNNFLIHVKPLSIIFKAKFRDAFQKKAPELFDKIPLSVWKNKWVVHIKSVGNGENALKYMAPYVFRVAIANSRILKFENSKVTFRYTNSKTGKSIIVTVDAFEFIRRFLQHVLPYKFMKVRYYGLFAAKNKEKLKTFSKLLFFDDIDSTNNNKPKPALICCPKCGNPMIMIEAFLKGELPRAP